MSVSAAGSESGFASTNPAISDDGRFIAFESAATNFVFGDGNGQVDIFVRDRIDNTITRASVNDVGNGGDGPSTRAALSSDGRFVAFESAASTLVPDDTNNKIDIFVRDQLNGKTVRVSVNDAGVSGNDDSLYPAISDDGRFVAFTSRSTNLAGADAGFQGDIFLHDRDTDANGIYDQPGAVKTIRISNGVEGGPGLDDSSEASISADGRYIAYYSYAPNLVAGDTNEMPDVFRYDSLLEQTLRVSVTPQGTQGDERSFTPSISADGQVIAFHSYAGNLVPNDQNGQGDVFVADLQEGPQSPSSYPWLVMLYLAGDDSVPDVRGQVSLTNKIDTLMSYLRSADANQNARIVVLYDGNTDGDSKLFVRDPGAKGLTTLEGALLPYWFKNELDSGDWQTLRNFIIWARATYPGAQHTMLSIVDHGGGWAPTSPDPIAQPRGDAMVRAGGWAGIALDTRAREGVGSSISTRQLATALEDMLKTSGPLDLLFLDACLMGMVEVAFQVEPYAHYLVAGQNLLWAQLPYDKYLSPTTLGADTSAERLAQDIVAKYNEDPPQELPYVIAALDLGKLKGLVEQTNQLALKLGMELSIERQVVEGKIRAAYAASQKFDYDASFSLDPTDAFVDLADFALHLQQSDISSDVSAQAALVYGQIAGAVGSGQLVLNLKRQDGSVDDDYPWNFAGAHGLSIYLPLGERDCRPTGLLVRPGVGAAEPPCIAPITLGTEAYQIEPQLKYYQRANQLRFSGPDGAASWAALLVELDKNTPERDPVRQPIRSPFQGDPDLTIYLPLLKK